MIGTSYFSFLFCFYLLIFEKYSIIFIRELKQILYPILYYIGKGRKSFYRMTTKYVVDSWDDDPSLTLSEKSIDKVCEYLMYYR